MYATNASWNLDNVTPSESVQFIVLGCGVPGTLSHIRNTGQVTSNDFPPSTEVKELYRQDNGVQLTRMSLFARSPFKTESVWLQRFQSLETIFWFTGQ